MEPMTITILLTVAMIAGLCLGLPITFVLGSIGVVFTFFLWPEAMSVIPTLIFGKAMMSFGLMSIPLFVLMGYVLQYSGIADKLFNAFYVWSGKVNGGLAVAAVIVCTLFAAMTGIGGAGTITMGLIALPAMIARGYDKKLALGGIGAGGALGILIPPSITMIIYGMICQVSIGRLFAGGLGPGLLLCLLYVTYILVACKIKPSLGPGIPAEECLPFKEKLKATKSVVGPLLLILLVLGSIFSGIATPTEGAAVGCAGSFILTLITGKFTWKMFKDISLGTLKLTGMVMWIIIGAYCFSTIYMALGASEFVSSLVSDLPLGYWGVFIIIQLVFFVLGMLLDPSAIVMITAPILTPIVAIMGYDPVWFGVIFIMNMQCAYITPPFGYNLFYLKSIAPEGVRLQDIYASIYPYIILQLIGLAIVAAFPQIALWLPNFIYGISG
ncbi:MAG: TRAP transporter large permease subunit [Smithella sp.]